MTTFDEFAEEFDSATKETLRILGDWVINQREATKELARKHSLISTNFAIVLLIDEGKTKIPKDIYNEKLKVIEAMPFGYNFHSYPDNEGNMYLWIEEKSAP